MIVSGGKRERESPLIRKSSGFAWATLGWASCNIDTFVSLVWDWILLSSLSHNQAYVPGLKFGSKTS